MASQIYSLSKFDLDTVASILNIEFEKDYEIELKDDKQFILLDWIDAFVFSTKDIEDWREIEKMYFPERFIEKNNELIKEFEKEILRLDMDINEYQINIRNSRKRNLHDSGYVEILVKGIDWRKKIMDEYQEKVIKLIDEIKQAKSYLEDLL